MARNYQISSVVGVETLADMRVKLKRAKRFGYLETRVKAWMKTAEAIKKGLECGESGVKGDVEKEWLRVTRQQFKKKTISAWKVDAISQLGLTALIEVEKKRGRKKEGAEFVAGIRASVLSEKLLTKYEVGCANWLRMHDEFVEARAKAQDGKPSLGVEVKEWCAREYKEKRNPKYSGWKRELLESSGVVEYVKKNLLYQNSKLDPMAVLGARDINEPLTERQTQMLTWLRMVEEYEECKNDKSGKKEISDELWVWLQDQRWRFLGGKLSSWKMEKLREVGFDRYCLRTGFKIGYHADELREHFKLHGTYAVRREGQFRELGKWRSRLAKNGGAGEHGLVRLAVPEMTDEQFKAFLAVPVSIAREEDKERNYKTWDAEENQRFEARFNSLNIQQAFKVIERSASVSGLDKAAFDAMQWLRLLNEVSEQMRTQQKSLVTVVLNSEQKLGMRHIRNRFMRGCVPPWQLKKLSEIKFETFVVDSSSLTPSERNIEALVKHSQQFKSILVEDGDGVNSELLEWRTKLQKRYGKLEDGELRKLILFKKLKEEFDSLSDEMVVNFFRRKI